MPAQCYQNGNIVADCWCLRGCLETKESTRKLYSLKTLIGGYFPACPSCLVTKELQEKRLEIPVTIFPSKRLLFLNQSKYGMDVLESPFLDHFTSVSKQVDANFGRWSTRNKGSRKPPPPFPYLAIHPSIYLAIYSCSFINSLHRSYHLTSISMLSQNQIQQLTMWSIFRFLP